MSSIVLASASPRRHALMKQIQLECKIVPAEIDETAFSEAATPEDYTITLSREKAAVVSSSYPGHLTIAADTVVSLDNQLLGKPRDENQALEYLKMLSGRTHQVTTGVTLADFESHENYREHSFHVTTDVTFDTLPDDVIRAYISTGSPMDKAGAYGIQDDWGALLVAGINGDYYNVVGFPLNRFYRELRRFAPRFLPEPGLINV